MMKEFNFDIGHSLFDIEFGFAVVQLFITFAIRERGS